MVFGDYGWWLTSILGLNLHFTVGWHGKRPKFALPDHHPRLAMLGRSSSSVFPRFESIWSMQKISHVNTGLIQQMQLSAEKKLIKKFKNNSFFGCLGESLSCSLMFSSPYGHPLPKNPPNLWTFEPSPASGVALMDVVVSASRSKRSLWRLEGLKSPPGVVLNSLSKTQPYFTLMKWKWPEDAQEKQKKLKKSHNYNLRTSVYFLPTDRMTIYMFLCCIYLNSFFIYLCHIHRSFFINLLQEPKVHKLKFAL